jgi:hypothetical protein
LFPHLVDVLQRGELFSGDHFYDKPTAGGFTPQAGHRHAAAREG